MHSDTVTTADDELLDVPEAAHRLRMSTEHVRRLARRGEIDSLKLGNRVRFRPSHIADFIARHES